MPPKSLEDIAKDYSYLKLSENDVRSIGFRVIDFLLENVTQEALDCGMYHMPSYVGDAKFEEAFKETLWAMYEQHFEKRKPEVAGLWVHIGHDGITLSKERHPYFNIWSISYLDMIKGHKI